MNSVISNLQTSQTKGAESPSLRKSEQIV